MARTLRVAGFAIAAMVVLGVAAVLVASRLRSREQARADAAPPAPAVLTERVQRRVLEVPIVFRGIVSSQAELSVMPDPPAGSDSIVSATPVAVGAEVAEGEVAAEVAGRPIVVLFGAVPAYRDLRPGDSGADVAQLERVLLGPDGLVRLTTHSVPAWSA